ncbi:LGT_TIGR03299, phage/plasmid-like protein TIGR03299 [uncultured Caudovirales phage]|uniref:LGT_TIGR03299, phage/plasmid-like protein TIGR03299 n=1 Tax=uncultured Caudovirales phage TaxID=2100421 RepID=A0A6J5NZM1_9CAUD|nr:LGT_TIGR03299, phage/plasmid-like protein TIGR03299 [uncultured Caudovirales phage]
MAHLIDMSNARANIAFAGATPWHGLGQSLEEGAPIGVWCEAAGLNYDVERAPVFAHIQGRSVTLENQSALYRNDTGAVLGQVSNNRYHIVQPREVVEFYRDLVADQGFVLDVAGALKGGAVVWALARNPAREIRIMGQDVIHPYLLLSTSYDGSRATRAEFTSVRVVCNNTLQMASADKAAGEGRVVVKHSNVFDEREVKARLGLADDTFAEFEELVNRLAEKRITREAKIDVITKLFASFDADNKLTAASRNVMRQVWVDVARSPGAGLRSADGTAWGLVNGITHFVDYHARARSADNRLNNAWFGKGAELKSKAVELALAA